MNFQSTVIVVSIINDSLLIPVPSINLSAISLISEISFDNYSDIVDRLLEILESKRGASFILFDSHVPSRPSTIYVYNWPSVVEREISLTHDESQHSMKHFRPKCTRPFKLQSKIINDNYDY